jgi:hypothetical protein
MIELSMVVYSCNPCTKSLKLEDGEFECSLGYVAKTGM